MFSLRRSFTRAITAALLTASGFADIVFLKNGEKIEGKIIKDAPEQITVEVKISAGITDERVVTRADIDRIEKVAPETDAYKAIATIQTGANSFAPAQYEQVVRALQGYVTQYPNGQHTSDVQKSLDEFVAEKKRVEAGEVKLRGQWLSKAEVEKEKVQLNGMIAFEHMKTQSTGGDGIGALNTFVVIEKTYPGAATMPDAIELAKQIVASLKPAVEKAIPNQKFIKAEKEKGFAGAGAADRTEMMEAYKKELAQAEAAVVAAEGAGQWPPFIQGSEKSLTALLTRVARETSRLAALPVDKMRKSNQLVATAKQKIADGDTAAASATLKEATALWPANELATRLIKEVAADEKAAAAKAAAEKAAATPEPKATPKPATPKPATPQKQAVAPAPKEDDKPFFMTLPGAISIVVGIAAVLAGVNVFKKMKAKKAEAE
jgi:hypothetical protein